MTAPERAPEFRPTLVADALATQIEALILDALRSAREAGAKEEAQKWTDTLDGTRGSTDHRMEAICAYGEGLIRQEHARIAAELREYAKGWQYGDTAERAIREYADRLGENP